MAIIYIASSHTHDLLQRSGNLHHPYLHNIQVLLSNLKGIQENFQNAIVINDSSAITLAQQKAEKFRQIGQEIASLDGKKAIAQSLRSQFDEYFAPAESATFMMLGIKPGDPMPELERMTVVLNKLTEALQHEELAAAQAFEKSLDKSRNIVQGML